MAASRATSDDNREEWDRLWSGRNQRQLRPPYNLGVKLDPRFGKMTSVTISKAPAEVIDRLWFETPLCPVCGGSTVGVPRLAAKLNLAFDRGISYGQIVWAHLACFESCPDTVVPACIPW
jgi:hypothetical protein